MRATEAVLVAEFPKIRGGVLLVGASVLVALSWVVPAAADHLPSGCFDGHDGAHEFPLTGAQVTFETENDPALGPFAGKSDTFTLDGPTTVQAAVVDADTMSTEIIEMDLTGVSGEFGTVKISESAFLASPGEVQAGNPHCFPASSDFDVYVQLDAPLVAHTHDAFHVEATIDSIPPGSAAVYVGPGGGPIDVFSGPSHSGGPPPGEFLVGQIVHAEHTPDPHGLNDPPPEGVPTLSEWGLLALVGCFVVVGVIGVRHRPRSQ